MSNQVNSDPNSIFIAKLSAISEKNDWTQNRIYKSAIHLEVKPTFDINHLKIKNHEETYQNLYKKLKANKETLEKIGNVYFSKKYSKEEPEGQSNDITDEFRIYKKQVMDLWSSDQNLGRIRNMLVFAKTFSNFNNIDKCDEDLVNNIDTSEISKLKSSKLLEIIKKYKYNFLLNLDYKNVTIKEKNNLTKFLENEIKKQIGVHDINDFYFDLTDTNKVIIKDVHDTQDHKCHEVDNSFSLFQPSTDSKIKLQKQNDSDFFVSRLVMLNDFRNDVKNKHLTDEQVMKYFEQTQDIIKAAGLYFENLYGTSRLTVNYILPDKKQYSQEFDLVASPEDLFMFVYSINPEVVDPKLFTSEMKQIMFDPLQDKFIGALNIPQNSILYVRYSNQV